MRIYVNFPGMTHTETGKRKVWYTDKVETYCCSLDPTYYVWEKKTKHNGYNGYTGYVSTKYIQEYK